MKFIRTIDGDYINQDCICAFTVETKPGYSIPEFVLAHLNNNTHAALREFQIPGNARAWLDRFIDKLNAEAIENARRPVEENPA